MSLTTGQALGPYTILSSLGAGGMGEVYRARDSRLGRDVAIKVLPADVAHDGTRLGRFRREAKALAAIDHPNIVTVFSVEEAAGPGQEGIHFLTMQLVEGKSLDHVISAGGLPLDRLLLIASAIADALTAAHDKNIVHRDLKPANVMVAADGRVKVLDFGLAKDLTASVPADATVTSAGHTEHGVVMGTPAYMSPEQVAGRAVDHRSDIFSFGILLYQMASGERPFCGASSAELASAILRDTPPLVTERRGDLPPDLARLIRRCMEKDPGERIQTARDVANGCRDLSRQVALSSGTPATARRASIAVLPFANMSAGADQDYFSDGLAEEIINLLARIPGLKVIARTSSFAFRGREQDVREIAGALGVTHVLEGSVRRAGNRVRVTAQLIAAADGGQLWGERYDRELSDLFALQDDIASAITSALRITLSGAPARRYVPKLAAYEAFLKARHHQTKVTPDSWALAKTNYESAVEIDPEFGLAHVGLAFYWLALPHFGQVSAHDAVPKAKAAAETALEIDPTLPEAHAVLGTLAAQFDFDWEAAERHFDAPLAREAGSPLTRPLYGNYLFLKGDFERAIELAERAIAEDPLEVWPRMNLHAYLQAAGRDKQAFEQAQKVLELDPNLVVARVSVAHFHAEWGELDLAVTAARNAYGVGSWYPDARATLAALLKRSGAEEEARGLQQSLGSGESQGDSRAQAVYHLLCGDIDAGADWTEKAIAERDFSMMYYLRFVICKRLRASQQWPAIAKMVNWPGAGSRASV